MAIPSLGRVKYEIGSDAYLRWTGTVGDWTGFLTWTLEAQVWDTKGQGKDLTLAVTAESDNPPTAVAANLKTDDPVLGPGDYLYMLWRTDVPVRELLAGGFLFIYQALSH